MSTIPSNTNHTTEAANQNIDASPPRMSDLADDTERKLHPNFISVERLVGWIVCGIFSFFMISAAGMILLFADIPMWLRILLAVMVLIPIGLLCWIAQCKPGIDYRYRSYRLNTQCIEIRKGILWRKVLNVPRNRLQHIDVNSGPIERKYGLAHLIIHTAGTISASVTLEGLDQETAIQIRDYLVAARSDDAV